MRSERDGCVVFCDKEHHMQHTGINGLYNTIKAFTEEEMKYLLLLNGSDLVVSLLLCQ